MTIKRSIAPRRRRGAAMILIALLLPLLIAMVAFAVEIGRMYLVRSQLQTAVDAGALASGLQLREDPDDIDAALEAGLDYVQRNRAGSFVTVPEEAVTITPGYWDKASRTFTPNRYHTNAIQVSGNLDKEPLFFGKALGLREFAVPRSAIAVGGGSPMDIILTLDLSGSMASQGRIQALQEAAPVFIEILEEVGDRDRVGVMGYGAMISQYNPHFSGHTGTLYTLAPSSLYPSNDDWCGVLEAELTFDLDYLMDEVLTYEVLAANKYNGWTPIGAAIRDSCHYLSTNARENVELVIVLMSDGHANKPSGNGPGYAIEMANYALSLDIKVYTISLGNAADENLMQQIADITGGEHFIASGSRNDLSDELADAFKRIADAMKQTQLVQ